jgi:hypothetical protein
MQGLDQRFLIGEANSTWKIDVLTICEDETLVGTMTVNQNKKNPRDVDIMLKYSLTGVLMRSICPKKGRGGTGCSRSAQKS